MAKTKTPFFSLGAKGSVGGSITAQGRAASTLIREKPFPTDPYSLPQAYQRWLYEDYAYLWRQQSLATQAEYRSAGVRHHLTGFQYWMSVMLRTLPDILGWWKLDEGEGAVAYDSSKETNNGTIIGASPADGVIAGAYYFDGINDRTTLPAQIIPAAPFTLECRIKLDGIQAALRQPFGQNGPGGNTFLFQFWSFNAPWLAIYLSVTNYRIDLFPNNLTGWHMLHWLHSAANVNTIFVDAVQSTMRSIAGGPAYGPPINSWVQACNYGDTKLQLSATPNNPTRYLKGWLDNFIAYNRLLDANERTRHHQRSY